eukprot:scaffold953_cov430-Prasinococcus_capsulatus_cf.AAC.2
MPDDAAGVPGVQLTTVGVKERASMSGEDALPNYAIGWGESTDTRSLLHEESSRASEDLEQGLRLTAELSSGRASRGDQEHEMRAPAQGGGSFVTIDGAAGITDSAESLKTARRMYILGFFGLPWMWGVSMYFFWPVVRGKVACEPQLRACEFTSLAYLFQSVGLASHDLSSERMLILARRREALGCWVYDHVRYRSYVVHHVHGMRRSVAPIVTSCNLVGCNLA